MALLMLDLDNTLVDRAGAFRSWAASFATEVGGTADDAEWLVSIDADGYATREEVAQRLRERFDLDLSVPDLVEAMVQGVADGVTTSDAIRQALRVAARSGWTPMVVTNGATDRQEAKLRRTGLDRLVAGWVVSEAVGVRKPDPGIFTLAAARVGESLSGAWMVGDNANADIGGANNAGISSAWVSRGQSWPVTAYTPTLVAEDCAAAIDAIVDGDRH